MKPENIKQRRSAFFKFLALFLITVLTILAAAYFDFNAVPKKADKLALESKKIITSEKQFQTAFYSKMKAIDSVMAKIEEPGSKVERLDESIKVYLDEMRMLIPKDSSILSPDMFEKMRTTYMDFKSAKIDYKSMSEIAAKNKDLKSSDKEKDEKISSLEKDLDAAKSKIRQLESDLLQAKLAN